MPAWNTEEHLRLAQERERVLRWKDGGPSLADPILKQRLFGVTGGSA